MKTRTLTFLMLLLTCSFTAGEVQCNSREEVRCALHDKCIPHRYICDNDSDCNDDSDETVLLCQAWRNQCSRGEVQCTRNGLSKCITILAYCTATNPPCEGNLDLRLCQMLLDRRLQPLDTIILKDFGPKEQTNMEESDHLAEEFQLALNMTLSHPQCPALYTQVDGHCLSIFHPGAISWGAAQAFCAAIGGELITLADSTHYAALVHHLRQARMTTDFWVGGRFVNKEQGWTWLDQSPMDLSSPFWAIRYSNNCSSRNVTYEETGRTRSANDGACYHYQQAPRREPSDWCVALTYRHYYRMTDEDCLLKKSPLCVITNYQVDSPDKNVTDVPTDFQVDFLTENVTDVSSDSQTYNFTADHFTG